MKNGFISTQHEVERVFLVGLQTGTMKRADAEASLEELRRLAESTDCVIVGDSLAHVRTPAPATFLSEGLAEALTGEIAASGADTVILDEDVTATQQRNLESRWKHADDDFEIKVVTRSELILDIFARRANTSEGKLQVELAQLQYRLPRLRGHGVLLSRLGGGIGTRGPGEMKLETDRRVIEQRIHTLEERILKLKRQRATQRQRRQSGPNPSIALVGYTNAGKSTLLNRLTGSEAFVEDKLFATLDTMTRRAPLPSGMNATFTDTVGFINRLPTQLAAAFRATLEEVQYADFLIHVVDATSARYEDEIRVTQEVLKELGAGTTPTVTAWNKIDRLTEGESPRFFERRHRPSAALSAITGEGVERLLAELESLITASRPEVWLKLDYKSYGDVNRIETGASVRKLLHRNDGIYILASLPPELMKRYEAHFVSGPSPE